MDLTTFITSVFCLTDDWLKGQRLRQRGPQPTLCDSEILTMEIVGEFLSYDQEKEMYTYFRRHWTDLFPKIETVHRTTFVRQAANLWQVKQRLWQWFVQEIVHDKNLSIVDSFPIEVCRFARANRCRLFPTQAAFGYDSVAKQTYYGLRAHMRICWPGVVTAVSFTPANCSDLSVVHELTEQVTGWLLGDRAYWSPKKSAELKQRGLHLEAPFKSKKHEKKRWPLWLIQKRRRIETVFGQLTGRFSGKKVWARDMWHFSSRWLRKILAHTVAVYFAQQLGLETSLKFSDILTD